MVAVEADGDVLEGFEGADDAFDADPGGVLEVAGYGQGGHDHGQVSLDGVSGVVEDRSGSQVVLAHPKGLLDVPQLVVGGDDLTSVHQACRDVGDVALETHQGPGPGDGHLIEDLTALMNGDKTRALGTLLASDDGPGPVGLSGQGLVVPGRALLGADPDGPLRARVGVRVPHRLGLAALVPLAPRAPLGGDGVDDLPVGEGVPVPVEVGLQVA